MKTIGQVLIYWALIALVVTPGWAIEPFEPPENAIAQDVMVTSSAQPLALPLSAPSSGMSISPPSTPSPNLHVTTPSPVQPFFWQPSQKVERTTQGPAGPFQETSITFTPRPDDTTKQIPFLVLGALNRQTLFYINPTSLDQSKNEDPDWFQRTLLYQTMRAMEQAQGFNANHFDYVKVRVVYDARFDDKKGQPRHYLMQRDIKLNLEDIRWYATPRRVAIPSNAVLETKLLQSAQRPFPSWLGREMLVYQPTHRVKAIILFAPGQSESTILALVGRALGIGTQLGTVVAGVRAGK
jgi:hypothetical protein